MMILCADGAADCASWQRARGLNWLGNDASLAHCLYSDEVLGAMAAVSAHEQAGVLATRVLAATNHPLLLKLTLGTWIVRPLKRFRHCLF